MNTATIENKTAGRGGSILSPNKSETKPGNKTVAAAAAAVSSNLGKKIIGEKEINLDFINFSPINPRTIFDEDDLREFGTSVKTFGLLQAILVRPHPQVEGRFELVCGERRTRASRHAGLTRIRAVIYRLNDEEVFEKQIQENLQRRDLTPMEKADSYARLLATVKIGGGEPLTSGELARRVCKTPNYVLNRLELTKLIEEAKDDLRRNLMPLGIALELAKLASGAQTEGIYLRL